MKQRKILKFIMFIIGLFILIMLLSTCGSSKNKPKIDLIAEPEIMNDTSVTFFYIGPNGDTIANTIIWINDTTLVRK